MQRFTLAVACCVYAVGQVTLGIAADSKAGITLRMKFGFGVRWWSVFRSSPRPRCSHGGNSKVTIAENSNLHVAGLLLFRGSAEILGGIIAIAIQIP